MRLFSFAFISKSFNSPIAYLTINFPSSLSSIYICLKTLEQFINLGIVMSKISKCVSCKSGTAISCPAYVRLYSNPFVSRSFVLIITKSIFVISLDVTNIASTASSICSNDCISQVDRVPLLVRNSPTAPSAYIVSTESACPIFSMFSRLFIKREISRNTITSGQVGPRCAVDKIY